MKNNQKRRKHLYFILSAATMLVFIAAVLWVSNNRFNDPLNKYQEAYGYSLKDIDVHYIDRLYISNFQDPQEEYVVSVEGNIEGTLFDLNDYHDGIDEESMNLINLIHKSIISQDKEPLFEISDNVSYKSRMIINTLDHEDKMILVFNTENEEYYIVVVHI